jgi:hypothetical protein
MNAYESFALSQILSEYPDGMTFDQVLDAILDGDETVVIWEPFEHETPERVVEVIDSIKDSAQHWFAPIEGCTMKDQLIALIRDMLKDYPEGSTEGLQAYKRLEQILKG